MTDKVKLSWENIETKVDVLADMLKDIKFDAVVSIGRGGMVPARLLAEKLDIHAAYIIDAKAYGADDKLGEMCISELKLAQNVKSVLVVDDVIFTGTTLSAVMEKIAENQQVTNIVNAFLYKNINTPDDVSANYCYAAEYDGNAHWLVFPWEKA